MSFGKVLPARCPSCGNVAPWITYQIDPPPIPANVEGGWLEDEESGQHGDCLACGDWTMDSYKEGPLHRDPWTMTLVPR